MKKIVSLLALLLLPAISFAEDDIIILAEHVVMQPGKTFEVPYQLPTSEYVIDCYTENNSGDKHIEAVEWSYKGTTFKTQLGYASYNLRFKVSRDDVAQTPDNIQFGQAPVADASGVLKFYNLGTEDAILVCGMGKPSAFK